MGPQSSLKKPLPHEALTRREREILAYLEKNFTNREIAEALALEESNG